VLAKHWPNIKRYGDIRECGKRNLESVDIISGGFPCQDISNAGKRAGIEGERSGLWSEMFRIICELRPRFVVVENVAALLKRDMGRVLGDLASVGYDAEWNCISCASIGGNHLRERVWIVAYPRSESGTIGGNILLQNGPDISEWWKDSEKWGIHRFESEVGTAPYKRLRFSWYEGGNHTSRISRLDDGIPGILDRIKAFGNAVVPQITEWIGRQIVKTQS
jgi:DNA (cytosine-5)-methyltransferase 1